MTVDWNFISELEGNETTGYVPDPYGSNSGVTIASGVDLGQASADEIARWPVDTALRQKLLPYAGIRKHAAVAFLNAHPLTFSLTECEALNIVVHAATLARVRAAYDGNVPPPPTMFDELPDRMQTVIASVAFQYGALSKKCPTFWRLAIAQDWPGMIDELNDFGDAYDTRREKEARYLQAPAGDGRAIV